MVLVEFADWRVIQAATSRQALAVARNRKVDLVISDICRPGTMDGLQFLEVFKLRHPGIPVIIASGNSSPANRYRAIWGGAYEFLPKPFTLEELLTIVQASQAAAGDCRTARRWGRFGGHSPRAV